MSFQFFAQLEKGQGYPAMMVTTEKGYDLMGESLTKRVGRDGPIVIINVRKYGLEGADGIVKAAELLHKLGTFVRLSEMIGGVFLTVNPKSGFDQGTLDCIRKAWDGANTILTATFNQRAPVCVLHVRQPEGSPNSWTAGLSAPAALAMHMVRRSEWHRTWIWNLSGEVEIDIDEMAKAEQMLAKGIRPLTYRESPAWLHPAMASFKEDPHVFEKAFAWLMQHYHHPWTCSITDSICDFALLAPLIRSTCLWVPLKDLDEVGLWSLQCNAMKGMEDWHHAFRRLVSFANLYPMQQASDVVCYRDSRFQTTDPNEQAKQRQKFVDEANALVAHFRAFFGQKIFEPTIPLMFQEFHMP